jgi:hypothetical protein
MGWLENLKNGSKDIQLAKESCQPSNFQDAINFSKSSIKKYSQLKAAAFNESKIDMILQIENLIQQGNSILQQT